MKIRKITIIGLGLLGGSLALALKKQRVPVRIIGTSRRANTVRRALKRGMIDEGTIDHKKAARDSDLIIICTPINKIIPLIKEIAPALKKDAIVTDVGSTKAQIVRQAEKIVPKRAFFVGGHPMAGREQTGLDAADASLFEGKPYILTVTKKTNRRALSAVESLVKKLNVRMIKLSPERQDMLVAGISHLPLAIAASLVNTVAASRDRSELVKVASSGFRDTTRIASGDPELGVDLFTTNKAAVLKMIASFKRTLGNLEKRIRSQRGLSGFLKNAKTFRDRMYK